MTVNASVMTNFSFGTGIISWPYDEADVDGGNDDGGVEDGGDVEDEDIDCDDNLPLANRHHITVQKISRRIIHWSPNGHLDHVVLLLIEGGDGKITPYPPRAQQALPGSL